MRFLPHIFKNNRDWAEDTLKKDPDFFQGLARQQSPEHLWIGCSDSRVAANQISGLMPGELFVHRNVANVVAHTDLNCLSVLQYAVDALRVRHVIVCGHYNCGGVIAAARNTRIGLIDNWLRRVQDVARMHEDALSRIRDEQHRIARLCELNTIEQVVNVSRTTIIQDAWARGQFVKLHGWIYGVGDGILRDLGMTVGSMEELEEAYARAVESDGFATLIQQ